MKKNLTLRKKHVFSTNSLIPVNTKQSSQNYKSVEYLNSII